MGCCNEDNFDPTPPPPSSSFLAFSYTVTGAEPDLSELVIVMPAVQPNAAYLVFPSQGTSTFEVTSNVAASSKTTSQFVLTLSHNATAGDVFNFIVTKPS